MKNYNSANRDIEIDIMEIECLMNFLQQSTIHSFSIQEYTIINNYSLSRSIQIININGQIHNPIKYHIESCFKNTNDFNTFLFETKIKPTDLSFLCNLLFNHLSQNEVKNILLFQKTKNELKVICKESLMKYIEYKKSLLL